MAGTIWTKNKQARMKFCRFFVQNNGMFLDMMDYIHIDKKWFYMTKIKENCYLLPNEKPPERSTNSKRFITKVMFMAAARARYDFTKKQLMAKKPRNATQRTEVKRCYWKK